jgi:hypothetical protein
MSILKKIEDVAFKNQHVDWLLGDPVEEFSQIEGMILTEKAEIKKKAVQYLKELLDEEEGISFSQLLAVKAILGLTLSKSEVKEIVRATGIKTANGRYYVEQQEGENV